MGIITKEVEIRVNAKIIAYYESLGYEIPKKKASKSTFRHTRRNWAYDFSKTIMVRIEDLPPKSNVFVNVVCEICKEIYNIRYCDYITSISNGDYYCCQKCSHLKVVETNRRKYNCDNVMQNKDIYTKQSNSLMGNYGVDTPLKSKEILKRVEDTMLKNFGVKHSTQSPEVRAKVNETLCKNGNQKTSKQQLYLHSLYGGELNFFIKYYATDICFPEEKLVIEYDGGGHDLRVTLGRLTQEEFDQKEIVRNNIIKREGYKQMRIISKTDKLPQDPTLLQMLSDARTYFSTYPNHSWIEFNIDTSTIRNAEQPDGIQYNYGSLRTVKDTDLQNDTDLQAV